MRRGHFYCIFIAAVAIVSWTDRAQAVPINLAPIGTVYTQNFDLLASVGTSSTLPGGWAMNQLTYAAETNTTSSATGGMKSYGLSGSTERALGSLASGVTGTLLYGAEFQNKTGVTITALELGYTGEQWRRGGNVPTNHSEKLFFEYSLNATSVGDVGASWISLPTLDFESPNATLTAASGLNGNAGANNRNVSDILENLMITNDSIFWIRFRDPNDPGNDHGLAVENFSLTPHSIGLPDSVSLPEPSSAILLASGMIALGFACRRRRTAGKIELLT